MRKVVLMLSASYLMARKTLCSWLIFNDGRKVLTSPPVHCESRDHSLTRYCYQREVGPGYQVGSHCSLLSCTSQVAVTALSLWTSRASCSTLLLDIDDPPRISLQDKTII